MLRRAKTLLGGGAIAAVAAFGCVALSSDFEVWASSEHPSATIMWKRQIESLAGKVPGRAEQRSALAGSSPAAPFDLLVIGGGATGCGVALDAATRGLRVGLIERDDFSSGTSSRSTKLVHGGDLFFLRSFPRPPWMRKICSAIGSKSILYAAFCRGLRGEYN